MGGPGLSGEPEREGRLLHLLAAERAAGLPPTFLNTLPQGILDDTLAAELEERGGFVGCRLRCFGTLARAMDEAKRLTNEAEAQGRDAYSGTVVVARELTEGRGRMGRTWFSPPGGIYLALLLSPELVGERMGLYPLAAGVAAATALRAYVPQARLKWVNDVHLEGRKMCGLLAESFFSARHHEPYLLLGVGANANITAFPAELGALATSLELELGRPVDLDRLCARLLRHLGLWLGLLHHHDQRLREEEFADQPPPNPVVAAFRALSDSFGRRVLYRSGDGDPGTEAKAIDVVEDGGLMLELDGGARHTAYGGEIIYLD